MNNSPIGIFDSGIGGLTVTKEIIKLLPSESIIYLGDTARVPYGNRTKEEVTQFAKQLVNFLLKKKVKALVAACNTISALSLEELEKISPIPILGVIKPAVKIALAETKNLRVGIIGTQATIISKEYDNEIKKQNPQIKIISAGCPLFVPLAEEGFHKHKDIKNIAEHYLDEINDAKVDTLILGCTHFPLLLDAISKAIDTKVKLVDPAKPTALELKRLLEEKNLLSDNPDPKYDFFVTADPQRVNKFLVHFFGHELEGKIKKVDLD